MATVLRQPDTGEPIYYSADMVDALNSEVREDPRYECVYGELFVTVTPPRPWHQAGRMRLTDALRDYAGGEPAAGYVCALESKFTFGRPDVYTQPDIWAVRMNEWRKQDWDALTIPLLLVEILSSSNAKVDRFTKRRAYMDAGVPLYWIVDGDNRWVEVWTPDVALPHAERERLVRHPEGARAPFTYALAELFAPV